MFNYCLRIGLLLLMNGPCFSASEKFTDDKLINKTSRQSDYVLTRDNEVHLQVSSTENKLSETGKENNSNMQLLGEVNSNKPIADKNGRNTDTLDSVFRLPENVPEASQYSLGQGDGWLLNNGIGPFNLPPTPKTLDADYNGGLNKFANNRGYDLPQQLQEEIRGTLGEDFYAKIVWSYNEIKGFDSLIQSSMAQYGFDNSSNGAQKRHVMELDDQLNLMVVFHKDDGIAKNASSSKSVGNDSWKPDGIGNQTLADEVQYQLPIDQEMKFSFMFKYLNLMSLLYFVLVILFVGVLGRALKYLGHSR